MQVYACVAVANLLHAYKSLEWNPISGIEDMESQIQGLLILSSSRGPLLSLQCVLICSLFKDWWYGGGNRMGVPMQRLESNSLLEGPVSLCLQAAG